MPERSRTNLLLYAAAFVIVLVVGVRHLQAESSGGGTAGATPGSGVSVPVAGGTRAGGAQRPSRSASDPASAEGADAAADPLDDTGGARLVVHVAGAVHHPGVYRLPPGSRVDSAVRRAGGATAKADLTAVNLAAELEDGRQIVVPERAAGAAGGTATGHAAGAGAGAGAAPTAPVNLNTATLEQLDGLDGVGPTTAQKILDFRQEHGGFSSVDDLGEIPGIGEKRLGTLRELVTV